VFFFFWVINVISWGEPFSTKTSYWMFWLFFSVKDKSSLSHCELLLSMYSILVFFFPLIDSFLPFWTGFFKLERIFFQCLIYFIDPFFLARFMIFPSFSDVLILIRLFNLPYCLIGIIPSSSSSVSLSANSFYYGIPVFSFLALLWISWVFEPFVANRHLLVALRLAFVDWFDFLVSMSHPSSSS